MATAVNAQIKEEIIKSCERAQKLQSLCDNYPKACGDAQIDGYGMALKEAAGYAILNSKTLENFYKRQIGETTDGVTDVTVEKPTLEQWVELLTGVTAEGVKVKEATDQATTAAEAAKGLAEKASQEKNPMKAAKSAKAAKAATAIIDFGSSATAILVEETAAQVNAVKQIIETLKSGKNL